MSIAMDSRRKDLALLIYGSLNFDTRGRIKLSPSVSLIVFTVSINCYFQRTVLAD